MSEKVREITWVAKYPTPELKYTSGDKLLFKFGARVNGDYLPVTYWPETDEEGQYLAENLVVGALVAIVGKTNERRYEKDGEEKVGLEVRAYHIGPLFGKPYEGTR